MTSTTSITDIAELQAKELDVRASDGVEVSLLWHSDTDRVVVEVIDAKTCVSFTLEVAPHEALDAFQHPFAYAAFRGIAWSETDMCCPDSIPCEAA